MVDLVQRYVLQISTSRTIRTRRSRLMWSSTTRATVHPHLRSIADQIPGVKPDSDILLLIGRDVPPLHKVRESGNGKGNSP